jgi:Rrf2 family iron-sulfur cluster assembly transcriptional regulator
VKLSTKSQYAISALIEIAIQDAHGPVPLSDLATNHKISLSYAEQLFAALRRNQLVRGTRGPGGGFRLTRAPEEITIAEIARAVYEDDGKSRDELESKTAAGNTASNLWRLLDRRIDEFLSGLTLADALAPLSDVQDAADDSQSWPSPS